MGESEQIERVTSDKPKNPGRQEWGKKLGKMQAEIKAKKIDRGATTQFSNMADSWFCWLIRPRPTWLIVLLEKQLQRAKT